MVVDCDLKSYFDTINHQKLMHRMQWYIEEKYRSPTYLEFLKRRSNGGRNSSSNFKRSLPREPAFSSFSQCLSGPIGQGTRKKKPSVYSIRGRFYYLCPKRAVAQRVQESITQFLEKKLRLTVNQEKSQIIKAHQLEYLSYRMRKDKGK